MRFCAHGALRREQLGSVCSREHIHIGIEICLGAHYALAVAAVEEYVHLAAGCKIVGYRGAVEVIVVCGGAGVHHAYEQLL